MHVHTHILTVYWGGGGGGFTLKCTSSNHSLEDIETRHQNGTFGSQFYHCATQNTFSTTSGFNMQKKAEQNIIIFQLLFK